VYWNQEPLPFAFANPSGEPNVCMRRRYPMIAAQRRSQGNTTVTYRIGIDGEVKDANVTQSSGSSALDNATLECVNSFRYFPVTQNGQPVEVDQSLTMFWRI
jgi:TonB family protein